MGKWSFFFFSKYLQYEIHLGYYTYFSSVGNPHLPWRLGKIIKLENKEMLVCASRVHVSQNLLLNGLSAVK